MTVLPPVSEGRQSTTRTVGRNYQSLLVMLIVSVFLSGLVPMLLRISQKS